MAEGWKSFCIHKEDTWMRMWWRHCFTNRREACSTLLSGEHKILGTLLCLFMLHMVIIKSQVSSTGLNLQKDKNSVSGAQILSCRDTFTCECKVHYRVFWTSRGSWAVQEDISTNSSVRLLHHPVISAEDQTEDCVLRLQIFFFPLKWDCSEYSLKLAGSVFQLLQWLLGQTPSASHQTLLFLLFFLTVFQYFW